ncbi:MAG: hypothetical protein AB9866_23620 [Syntrophobacteraceae bacterium]
MSDYLIEIEGKHELAQIELQIAGEEAAASEFIESSISSYSNRITNIVLFRELPAGSRPKDVKLIQAPLDSPPPAGTTLIWRGLMMVGSTPQVVMAVRVQAHA